MVVAVMKFIVFEGLDGSGKTTQARLLHDRIRNVLKEKVLYTFEPTNNDIGRLIRQYLKGEISLDPKSLPYLFAADRALHLYDDIIPELQHSHVICDRYILSSYAYQPEIAKSLNEKFPSPDLTFYLRVSPEFALERMKTKDKDKHENLETQKRAYLEYERQAETRKNWVSFKTINGEDTKENISEQIWYYYTRSII